MESREFFRRARKLAAEIAAPHVVVASKETSDGGREGVLSFVAKELAARLILRDLARLATDEEVAAYHAEDARRRQAFEADQMRQKIHVALANNFTSELVVSSLNPAPEAPKQQAPAVVVTPNVERKK